jgi:hypothetical protein
MSSAGPVDPLLALTALAAMTALTALADGLARQRQALEAGDLSQLAGLNAEIAQAFDAAGGAAGGEGALPQAIARLPDSDRQALRTMLLRSEADNLINGELIRITMHRVAAIQAFRAASSEAGTYGPGASGSDNGTRLSRRA